MGWNAPDVYYQPEKFGLKIVAEIDYSDGCYVYDTRVVWRHEDGKLYTARDSGCSCTTPFEDFTDISALDELDPRALIDEVKEEAGKSYANISFVQASDFLARVASAVE